VPVLDLMQTIPVFAYLVPILILFGFGPTSAMIATLIYAMPPMTRSPCWRSRGCRPRCGPRPHGRLHAAADDVAGDGPSAQEALMVGVNQVIMLSLNMVIIASMIGAGGWASTCCGAAPARLRRGARGGLAIVALAIALDRLSQARAAAPPAGGRPVAARHPYLLGGWCRAGPAPLAGLACPRGADLARGLAALDRHLLVRRRGVDQRQLLRHARGGEERGAAQRADPVQAFLIGLPWLGVALCWPCRLAAGRPRLALLSGGGLTVLIAFDRAVGRGDDHRLPLRHLGRDRHADRPAHRHPRGRARPAVALGPAVIDTLQTLPSFVYLMPAVMLFRVGDFTAMIAVVAYRAGAGDPLHRAGPARGRPAPDRGGRAMGCTPWQILTRIRLKLALPEILLGLNQTIMFALSMLVITALVGTRDLGQEVYIALTKADAGRGLVAGLCVAFIAIIADRLIQAPPRARARAAGDRGDGRHGAACRPHRRAALLARHAHRAPSPVGRAVERTRSGR
jgi:glycine betaine/proline transport system permease protein